MLYLSELFLSILEPDFRHSSVARAVEVCNSEYLSRNEEEPLGEYELRDFAEVFEDFRQEFCGVQLPLLKAVDQISDTQYLVLKKKNVNSSHFLVK